MPRSTVSLELFERMCLYQEDDFTRALEEQERAEQQFIREEGCNILLDCINNNALFSFKDVAKGFPNFDFEVFRKVILRSIEVWAKEPLFLLEILNRFSFDFVVAYEVCNNVDLLTHLTKTAKFNIKITGRNEKDELVDLLDYAIEGHDVKKMRNLLAAGFRPSKEQKKAVKYLEKNSTIIRKSFFERIFN